MLTLHEPAKRAGISPHRLNQIERGEGPDATIEEIERIALALGMPAWKVIELAEEDDAVE
jgi:transcriptional regulator with XRE-family HTH domain